MIKNNAKVILDIQNLKKYFNNSGVVVKAADDITFKVHEGEIVGLIGESGSGKTTVGRSLLRLYDDFNGFVSLDGKIISGKRLSHNRKKFLRKNIQMIFQDPHAALNGQKNIYSTLKEPLIVNGIMKERLRDIFSDWSEIKENFFYTFQKRYKTLELENLESINRNAESFFYEWRNKFDNYQYDENQNDEDNFNVFYNYLEEKQNMESEIVNNMYENTEKLINFYYQIQKDYREKNLDQDEKDLIEATKNYEKVKELTKKSLASYNALRELVKIKEELQEFNHDLYNERKANANTFNSYISEYKNEFEINRFARLNSSSLDYYIYNFKKQLINKTSYKLLKNIKKQLGALSVDNIRSLCHNLELYNKDFFAQYLDEIKYNVKSVKKQIKAIVNEKYNFDFAKYLTINNAQILKNENQIDSFKNKIYELKAIIDNEKTPQASDVELEEAHENYQKYLKIHNEAVEQYIINFKQDIDELNQKIAQAKAKYQELKDIQTYTDKKFQEVSKKYFDILTDKKVQLSKTDKDQSRKVTKIIPVYKNRIASKLLTLKSFGVEVKYLNKDLKAIKKLLGISNDKKANSFKKFTQKFITYVLARRAIKNLLIKTTIYNSLEDVGLLKQFAYRYPHEFSGGQRQRIVIARALITQPKVIVADEPIASLDISIQAQVVNLLKDLCEKKNIGMIFIAHDLSMIEYIADRVQIMHLGKIVESGDTDVVYANPVHPYTINLFKAIPKISNANEKFENISFELNYLNEQRYPNIPQLYQVEDNHYIYGTDNQVQSWAKEHNLDHVLLTDAVSVANQTIIQELPIEYVNPNYTQVISLADSNDEDIEITTAQAEINTAETTSNVEENQLKNDIQNFASSETNQSVNKLEIKNEMPKKLCSFYKEIDEKDLPPITKHIGFVMQQEVSRSNYQETMDIIIYGFKKNKNVVLIEEEKQQTSQSQDSKLQTTEITHKEVTEAPKVEEQNEPKVYSLSKNGKKRRNQIKINMTKLGRSSKSTKYEQKAQKAKKLASQNNK